MIIKQIAATTGVDKQNQRISLDALNEYAQAMCSSPSVPRMSINHDATVLPIGKIISGTLKPLENNEVALEVAIDNFIDEFIPCTGPNGEELCVAESTHDSRPFIGYEADFKTSTTVLLNPFDYAQEDYNDLVKLLDEEYDTTVEQTIAKSMVPDPTVIVLLVAGFFSGAFCNSVIKKTTDKLSEAISDDLVTIYSKLKAIIKAIAGKIMAGKQVAYVFCENNSPIELVVKARTADAVAQAFDALASYDVEKKVEQFSQYTNGQLHKIQFVYDDVTEKWEMSYLTTKTGKVIGTMKKYKQAVKMYKEVMSSPTAGFSIAGPATISEEENDA